MGRLWLMSRLELAERGVTLLEEKLRLLASRRDGLKARVEVTRSAWETACREADVWYLRALMLGGQGDYARHAPRTSVHNRRLDDNHRGALSGRCAVRASAHRG